MRYFQCKCGNAQYFASGMVPQDCEGCDDCNTTFAQHPDGHKERIPHEWRQQYNRNTGQPDGFICNRCFAHKRE